MFKEDINVKLSCPKHPDYNPREDNPFEGCRYCIAMNDVAKRMKQVANIVQAIQHGLYEASDKPFVREASPPTSEIAYVVTDTDCPRGVEVEPKPVRKVKGGVKVKAAPQKPDVESVVEPVKAVPPAPPVRTPADNGMLL